MTSKSEKHSSASGKSSPKLPKGLEKKQEIEAANLAKRKKEFESEQDTKKKLTCRCAVDSMSKPLKNGYTKRQNGDTHITRTATPNMLLLRVLLGLRVKEYFPSTNTFRAVLLGSLV